MLSMNDRTSGRARYSLAVAEWAQTARLMPSHVAAVVKNLIRMLLFPESRIRREIRVTSLAGAGRDSLIGVMHVT